jgi:hypothetical protein
MMLARLNTNEPSVDVGSHIRKLERLLKRKTMEIEILQEALLDARAKWRADLQSDPDDGRNP